MAEKSISSIPLVEVINALREDLKTAQKKSDPKYPLIIEEIEVELQVVVTKGVEGKGKGKAKLEVLLGLGGLDAELEGKASWAKAATQKIKLKLSAGEVGPDGKTKKLKLSN